MKVIGGNMGSGSAKMDSEGRLIVRASTSGTFVRSEVQDIDTEERKEKNFSAISFLLGVLLLGALGLFFLGVIGLIIALVLSVAGSFHSKKIYIIRLSMSDGSKVTLDCSKGELERALFNLRPGPNT